MKKLFYVSPDISLSDFSAEDIISLSEIISGDGDGDRLDFPKFK